MEMAEKKKITLSFENYHLLPNYVRGDKDRIQQIIENLIVNSIKYGKLVVKLRLPWLI
jgi:two-component system phosphate regulon sensor histidine kinase PhoR